MVFDQRKLMHCRGRLDRDESDQRRSCSIAAKHHDLHTGLHRGRRYVANGQYDGCSECRPGSSQRRLRIGERHERIVCTLGQSLLNRDVVVRGRLGPVDMELRRFQRRHYRELLRVGVGARVGICATIKSC